MRALLVSPPVVGAAYVVGLAAWSGSKTAVDADVGDVRRTDAIETFMARRFPAEIARMKIGVIATAIALGLLIGLLAELLLRLRHGGPKLARRSASGALVEAAWVVAALHAMLVLWGMADTPQLYAATWYAEGGLRRTVQIFATDSLGPRGVVLATLVLVVVYLRPSRAGYLARRLLSVARRPLRVVAMAVAKRSVAPMLAIAIASSLLAEGPQVLPVRVAHAAAVDTAADPTVLASAAHAAAVDTAADPAREAPTNATSSAKGDKQKPLNVLILAADSLRADRLEPRIAPNLSRLADRGTRFERAYVSMPRTFPSWVTILTGRHAHHHGVRSMFPTWETRAKDFDALPARFTRAGYATSVVSDYAGDIFARIDLGFSRVETPSFDFRQIIRQKAVERETPLLPVLHSHVGRTLFPVMRELSAAADPDLLADDVESALRSVRHKPFFMTVFFSTAHFPYAAPAPYYAKYTDPSYRGRFKYHKPLSLSRTTDAPPDADDVRQIRALYDGAVTGIDDAVGRVLRSLERLDLAERTIVVVTADHGEMLFDNDHGQGHGDHLFGDEVTHVPLVIFDPRGAAGPRTKNAPGRREAGIVRDVDLAPTLYELAGVTPPPDLDGRSLASSLRGEPLAPRFGFAETELWFTEDIPGLAPELRIPYPGIVGLTEIDARHSAEVVLRKDMTPATLMARHRMIRDGRFKLVYVPTRVGVRYMLFDTVSDPAETEDVSGRFPGEVTRLRAELWAWMLEDRAMEQKDGYLVPRPIAQPQGASR